jgi:hypothetical protein
MELRVALIAGDDAIQSGNQQFVVIRSTKNEIAS